MNINSFHICPKCSRMHETRVEICGTCGFNHLGIDAASVGSADNDVKIYDGLVTAEKIEAPDFKKPRKTPPKDVP